MGNSSSDETPELRADELFKALDFNHDGRVTLDELESFIEDEVYLKNHRYAGATNAFVLHLKREIASSEKKGLTKAQIKEKFTAAFNTEALGLDAAALSISKRFVYLRNELLGKLFNALDVNEDDVITKDELKAWLVRACLLHAAVPRLSCACLRLHRSQKGKRTSLIGKPAARAS
jgi:hypothetical protein